MNVYGISFVSGLKGPIDTNAWRIRDLVRASGWVVQGCIRSGTYFGIRFQKMIISSFPISSVRVSHWHNVFFFLVFSGHNQKTLNKNEKAIPNQNSFSVVFMLFTETFVTESGLVSLPHLGSKFRRFSIFPHNLQKLDQLHRNVREEYLQEMKHFVSLRWFHCRNLHIQWRIISGLGALTLCFIYFRGPKLRQAYRDGKFLG